MADKYMKGQRYTQAAEKYSEAIDTLPKVPSAASNILPLYNNRSAMYEKSGAEFYDKALNDIALVLQLDARHMKARVRRARILEAKGKINDALIDYTVHFYMEQAKGVMPSSAQKVEDLSKVIAYAQAAKNMDEQLKMAFDKSGGFQQSTDNKIVHVRDLPAKSFIRTTLDNFPSLCKWKTKYADIDLQELIERYNSFSSADSVDKASLDKVSLQLEVVCCALAKESYKIAFNYLSKTTPGVDLLASNRKDLLELRSLLCGIEMYLRRNLLGAEAMWKGAVLSLQPHSSPELSALLAEAQLNLGNLDTALSMFNEVISNGILKRREYCVDRGGDKVPGEAEEEKKVADAFPLFTAYLDATPSSESAAVKDLAAEVSEGLTSRGLVYVSFILMLRANVWTGRAAANGYKMRDDPITPARIDFEVSYALAEAAAAAVAASGKTANSPTDDAGSNTDGGANVDVDGDDNAVLSASARHAQVQSLCKRIHLLASTKGLAGAMHTPEDVANCEEYVETAKRIDASNKTLSLLAIDVLAMGEKFEESAQLVDTFIANADKDEGVPYVMKANILTHQGMSSAKNPADQEATFAKLKEAADLYDRAMEVEPGCVEARAQACQLKCIVGDMEAAAQLAEQVVKLARSRDEALDLEHLLLQTSSQIAALKELYAANQG
eukprot:GHVU01214695.1.p1 GENE.GHVU01214695.1~~GHVU01214695.1.p1  ORF type:complete len:783 (+),score=153.53 GHVU01214695.1:348-2351(+)